MRERILSIRPALEFLFVVILTFGVSGLSYIFRVISYNQIPMVAFTDSMLIHGTIWQICIILFLGCFLYFRNWRLQDFPFRITPIGAAGGIALVVAFYFTYAVAYNLLLWFIDPARFSNLNNYHVHLHLPAILLASLVNPFFEEFITLGYVVKSLESHGISVAIGASTFLRLFVHLYQGPLAVASILPLGILFAVFYWRFRNLWPFVFAHFFLDLIPFLRLM